MMLPSFFLIRRPVQTTKPEMKTGIATAMRVDDVYVQNRRLWVNLREKGGKAVALPCHHTLEAYLMPRWTARPWRAIRRDRCLAPWDGAQDG